MGWAIFGDATAKLNQKLMMNTLAPATNQVTDTADHGHCKFAFHNAINTQEFAKNSCVVGKNSAGCQTQQIHLSECKGPPAENSHLTRMNIVDTADSSFMVQ